MSVALLPVVSFCLDTPYAVLKMSARKAEAFVSTGNSDEKQG